MIKIYSSIVVISFVIGWALLPKSSLAEPVPVFAKDPGIMVDYSKAEGVELTLSKMKKEYYIINITTQNTDSADCYCPVWSSRPISPMMLFAIVVDEPGQCEDTILISSQRCGIVVHSGSELAKWISQAPDAFKDAKGNPDSTKYYIRGSNISIPDSFGVVHSYWGKFPIYELSGKNDTLDVTFSLQQDCVVGSLKDKTKLFRKRGLTMRLFIDQRKGFPVITKVP